MRVRHLIDALPEAEIAAPGPAHVTVTSMSIARDRRMALFQHPPSTITLPPLSTSGDRYLELSCGLRTSCVSRVRTHLLFRVSFLDEEGDEVLLREERLDPAGDADHRRWRDFRVELPATAPAEVTLRLEVSVPPGASNEYCWAGWGEPRLVDHPQERPPPPPVRREAPPVFLLITADGLRADALSCYGGPTPTPSLDALASEGVRFEHVRTQSTGTLPAYASMLTGQHVPVHGVDCEWGHLPASLPSLPVWLAAHGWDTVLAASESELVDPRAGFSALFQRCLPCLGEPSQRGDVTQRAAQRVLEEPRRRPTFLWTQFFDIHPPLTPPEPYASHAYPHDPASPERAHREEDVARIRGVESIFSIQQGLAAWREGHVDHELLERLRATARALAGGAGSWPDLAEHVHALGAPARRNLTERDFASWLAAEAERLARADASDELIAWLEEILGFLASIEEDILEWLDGVEDFRYTEAMYQAAVASLDEYVGRLLDTLRDTGGMENATVVLASPHGQNLDEAGMHFHHHNLLETVVQVPLLIRPSSRHALPRGHVSGDVANLIDLFPTTCDLLGHPAPSTLPGASLLPALRGEGELPPRASFTVEPTSASVLAHSGGYLLHWARGARRLHPDYTFDRGDRAFFEAGPLERRPLGPEDLPGGLREELEERLAAWAESVGLDLPDPSGRAAP